jgi:uncharacterized protein (TIGR03435 family)
MPLRLCIALVLATAGWAQQASSFEAATVRVSSSDENGKRTVGPAGIAFRTVTMLDCVASAYEVHDYQVVGPDWLHTERYDVIANAASPAAPKDLMAMLRKLLAERFHLAAHEETRELPVYAMVIGKAKPRLREATPDSEEDRSTLAKGTLQFHNITMAAFAEYLGRMRSTGRPVIDRTGLAERYDFSLRLFEEAGMTLADMKRAMSEASDGTMVLAAVESQLGLKLVNRRAPYRVVVVDGAERVPKEN